jgi:hypothetical protein
MGLSFRGLTQIDGKAVQANTLTTQLESTMPTTIQVRFIQPEPYGKPLVIDSN